MTRENRVRLPEWLRRPAGTSQRRHWIRVVLLLIFVAVPLLVGWHYRPHAQKAPDAVGPSIVVLASKPGVAATVNATLSIGGRREGPGSVLLLTLIATSKLSGTVKLAVELNDFPSGTTVEGTEIFPMRPPAPGSASASLPVAAEPYPRGYSDYAFPETLTKPLNSSAAMRMITIRAPKPIGEASKGDQLRVAFPVLRGESPGASIGYKTRDLFPGAASLLGARTRQGFSVTLAAGTSTFSDTNHPLSGYQVLAGDPPTLLGATNWGWDGINDATVLAANLHAQDIDQLKVFYSGLALGLAFAAFITLLLELIPVESSSGTTEKQASADQQVASGVAELSDRTNAE